MHIAVEAGSKQQQHDVWILSSDELRLLLNFFIFFAIWKEKTEAMELKQWYNTVMQTDPVPCL